MLQFSKYQGLGNDFLILDVRSLGDVADAALPDTVQVARLCDRRFGVGADGLIAALPPLSDGEVRMRIFNTDGSEPEMCGNGIRCLARFLADSDGAEPGRRWQIETGAGRIVPELRPDGLIKVDMGPPFLTPESVPTALPMGPNGVPEGILEVMGDSLAVAAAGMGNPHVVVPVTDVAAVELETLGPLLETHPAFPAKTNVHFVEVVSPEHLRLRVWERGAGPTLACGTGACATLVVCHSLGLCARRARLDLPGGPLEICWDAESGHVLMTGPALAVFDGVVAPELLERGTPGTESAAAGSENVPASAPAASPEPQQARGTGQAGPAAPEPIDCAQRCREGCIRPEACSSAEAIARVEALLGGRSLDELVAMAADSLELRTRRRAGLDQSDPS